MIDSYVIDKLRRRQEERRIEGNRPRLELPLHPPLTSVPDPDTEDRRTGTVVVIDVLNPDD